MQLCGRTLEPGGGPFVVGILNVTPDSFSDGGKYFDPAAAVEAGCRMADEGADVIDVGGESTKPGSGYVPADEQIRRTQPVIAELAKRFQVHPETLESHRRDAGATRISGCTVSPGGPAISIDTRLAAVAKAALDAGATMINDVSALRDDPALARLAADRGAGVILMHMKGTPADMQHKPAYCDVVGEIREFWEDRIAAAVRAGIPRERIIVDPGIGFGKTTAHNLEILGRLAELRELLVPVMVGPSRKRFIGEVLGLEQPADRLMGTMAAVAACVLAGVELVRVHDVAAARQVADVCKAIRG